MKMQSTIVIWMSMTVCLNIVYLLDFVCSWFCVAIKLLYIANACCLFVLQSFWSRNSFSNTAQVYFENNERKRHQLPDQVIISLTMKKLGVCSSSIWELQCRDFTEMCETLFAFSLICICNFFMYTELLTSSFNLLKLTINFLRSRASVGSKL